MRRRVFFSFHYDEDNWRAAQVRNMGLVDGNRPVTDNDWETVKQGGSKAIANWIDEQMHDRSCTVLLVGRYTAGRKWINYEIQRSWEKGMGLVGIYIHGLKNQEGIESYQGENPFEEFKVGRAPLSNFVRCYQPPGISSRLRYKWISRHLSNMVDEAIDIRSQAA